jgi:uncharacterized membrane protein YphA (DoxX/SURF4 family)
MLNPLPQLLDFSFFAPTLLRGAVAVAILAFSYRDLAQPNLTWHKKIFALLEIAGSLLLIVGAYTQITAMILIALTLFRMVFVKNNAGVCPADGHRSIHHLIIIIILISLLLTGAGLFAFDIPL